MTKPAERLRKVLGPLCMFNGVTAVSDDTAALLDECERALAAYKAAWDSLFEQCLSNGMTNAWGVPVNLTLVNEAQRGEATLAKLRGEQ